MFIVSKKMPSSNENMESLEHRLENLQIDKEKPEEIDSETAKKETQLLYSAKEHDTKVRQRQHKKLKYKFVSPKKCSKKTKQIILVQTIGLSRRLLQNPQRRWSYANDLILSTRNIISTTRKDRKSTRSRRRYSIIQNLRSNNNYN